MNISKHFMKHFKFNFYITSKLTKCIITYTYNIYISEIHCCIVKSTNLSTILPFCKKNLKKLKIKKYCVVMATLECKPAFSGISVGHFQIIN